jgi:hypothetical protein
VNLRARTLFFEGEAHQAKVIGKEAFGRKVAGIGFERFEERF